MASTWTPRLVTRRFAAFAQVPAGKLYEEAVRLGRAPGAGHATLGRHVQARLSTSTREYPPEH